MLKGKNIIIISSVVFALMVGIFSFFAIKKAESEKVDFIVQDTLPAGNGKTARVILLGGQSNASGCSRDEYLQKNTTAEKYSEYKNGYDNVYINYFASATNESQGFVKCATAQGEAGGYFGPELGMAEKLNELFPDESFFIIKYAWGGTNLFEQWLSPSSKGKTGALYNSFVKFVEKSLEYLVLKGYEVKIEGMCWMQGESDSFSVKNATAYESNLKNFINDVRKSFSSYAANDGIAFVDASIADNPVFWVYCEEVNKSKQKVADTSPLNLLVDTNANGLTCSKEPEDAPDLAHYDSLSELKLGHLFIEELSLFLN